MLATFRRSLNKPLARLFFLALAAVFVLWGVSGKINLSGIEGSGASVGGRDVNIMELQDAYRRELLRAQQTMNLTDPTAEQRRAIAIEATQRVLGQVALDQAQQALGVAVPDDALRQAVFEVPQFQNQQGQFDRAVMQNVLRNNGLNEARFLDLKRKELGMTQVFGAITAGVAAPIAMADQVFAFAQEKRVADAVEIPLATAAPPPNPTDLQLQRWWANHPESYSTPEYRRVKAVVLAPQTMEKTIAVGDDELKAAFEQHKSEFNRPERRTVQVILTQDEAQAQALAALWGSGADWSAVQAEASKDGAAPVELTDASQNEFPAPELGAAVFAAEPDKVSEPLRTPLGWHVFKVTRISGGVAKSLDDVRDQVRARVVAEKAAEIIYDRANKVENLLSSGTALDALPGDLDLAAVTGTLDALGNTPKGEAAPIPGPKELRTALIQAAFSAKVGEAPKLTQAPNAADGTQSFFAVSVEEITPPAPRPFAEVAERVRADWAGDEVRRAQESVAAQLVSQVKLGASLADAAAKAGLTVKRLPATGRAQPAPGVPANLAELLFSLKPGEATMVESPAGFTVAALVDIQRADPKSDPVGFGQIKDALARSMQQDMQSLYANAVRARGNPQISNAVIDALARPGE